MSQLAMSPPKASQGRSNTGFFDTVKKKKKIKAKHQTHFHYWEK